MAETPQQNETIQTSRTLHYCQERGNRYTQIEMQLLYQVSGGTTSSMLQHFRTTHRQLPAILADFLLILQSRMQNLNVILLHLRLSKILRS